MTVGRGPFYSLSVKSQTENGIQNNGSVITPNLLGTLYWLWMICRHFRYWYNNACFKNGSSEGISFMDWKTRLLLPSCDRPCEGNVILDLIKISKRSNKPKVAFEVIKTKILIIFLAWTVFSKDSRSKRREGKLKIIYMSKF